MKRRLFLLSMNLLLVCTVVIGQALKPVNIPYFQDKKNFLQQNSFEQNVIVGKNISTSNYSFPMYNSSACSLKCTLPKGAIFCRMEDVIYNKLNFWIKFRMGTDDRYSN